MIAIVHSVKFKSGLILELRPSEGRYNGIVWFPHKERLCEFTQWKDKKVHKLVGKLKTFTSTDMERLHDMCHVNQMPFWDCVKLVQKERP